jgi:MerR HTH family regulatory protein
MMVAYSGTNGRTGRYLCSRTFQHHGTRRPCQGIGALRVDPVVTTAFLDAVTPAGVDATAHALQTLQAAHEERVRLQRLAVERVAYEAERARRQYDACEPEHRLVARTLEHALEAALAALDDQKRAQIELQRQRPAPLTDTERAALKRLAADLPRVWDARTTSDRDRKQLLRCLLDDVVVTVERDQHSARVELFWQGGAHSELAVALNRTPAKRTDTPADLVALIGRLAEHSADAEIAMILAKQGRRTATGLAFTASRVADIRERANISAGPHRAPTSDDGVSIHEAARQLSVCTQTIRRWLREGLLPAEQTTPHVPWRITLSDDIRRRFIPDVPDGYVRLADAAAHTGLARQTILSQIRRGDRDAIQVTKANAADSASNSTPKNKDCCPQRPAMPANCAPDRRRKGLSLCLRVWPGGGADAASGTTR